MTKEQVTQAMETMPNSFPLDELIDRLIMLDAIERGRQQYRDGRYRTHAEVKERLKKWLQ